MIKKVKVFYSFDEFVCTLSYLSSWSTGMAFWKDDFNRIIGLENANALFPHTDILFAVRDRKKYIIDDTCLLDEIPTGDVPKGRYNLFNAFAVEYPTLILELYKEKSISMKTFNKVKQDNLKFIRNLYYSYILTKSKCSYDLSNYKASINCFYSMFSVWIGIPELLTASLLRRIIRIIKK